MGNFKSGFQSLAQTTKIWRIPILEFFNSIAQFKTLVISVQGVKRGQSLL